MALACCTNVTKNKKTQLVAQFSDSRQMLPNAKIAQLSPDNCVPVQIFNMPTVFKENVLFKSIRIISKQKI